MASGYRDFALEEGPVLNSVNGKHILKIKKKLRSKSETHSDEASVLPFVFLLRLFLKVQTLASFFPANTLYLITLTDSSVSDTKVDKRPIGSLPTLALN